MRSARLAYIVCYDICDPGRLRKVYKAMRGYGDHWQLSVFRCELTRAEKVAMLAELGNLVHHDLDQVLIIPIGPPTGRNATSIETIGVVLACPEHHAVVV